MSNIKNELYVIKELLEDNIDYSTALLNAWRSLTRVHKKDGSDFVVLSKNVAGKFHIETTWNEKKELCISARSKRNGYVFDSIRYNNETDTANDLWEAINARIALFERHVDNETKDLAVYETVVTEFSTAVHAALDKVDTETQDWNSSLPGLCKYELMHKYF